MCILKDLITHKESFPCYDHTRVNDIIGINKIHELRNFLPVVVRAVSVCSRFFFHNAITHTHTHTFSSARRREDVQRKIELFKVESREP